MRRLLIAVVVSTLMFCSAAPAQEAAHHVPKYITIQVEHVKAGRTAAHNKLETNWTAALKKAGMKTNYLGLVSFSGPTEAWWISGFDSLAAVEASNKESDANAALTAVSDKMEALDTENVDQYSSMIARFVPELSYHPDVNIGEYKMFHVTVLRSKLGHYGDLLAATKIFNDARDKAGSPLHEAAFEVMQGGRSGTYLLFVPMKSLAEDDENAMSKKVDDAIGEAGWKRLTEIADQAGITLEERMFSFLPSVSYPTKEMTAANPDFWNPKPKMAKAAAATPEMAAKDAKAAEKKTSTDAKK
jgi:hypothetical protein